MTVLSLTTIPGLISESKNLHRIALSLENPSPNIFTLVLPETGPDVGVNDNILGVRTYRKFKEFNATESPEVVETDKTTTPGSCDGAEQTIAVLFKLVATTSEEPNIHNIS
jgi:hypothetical protein